MSVGHALRSIDNMHTFLTPMAVAPLPAGAAGMAAPAAAADWPRVERASAPDSFHRGDAS